MKEENRSNKEIYLRTGVFFSVVVPVYNAGNTLRYCVDSVLNQSFDNFELILVDDGSKDNSWELCKKFQKESSKVKIFHTNNNGVSHARNYALKYAKGKYVAFIDSDDYVDKYFLEKVYKHIDNKTQLVVVGVRELENEKFIKESSYSKYGNSISNIEFLHGVFEKNMFNGYLCNKIFDMSIINANNLSLNETISICEDTLFCFEYANYIDKVSVIDEPLYMYIRHENSATLKMDRNKILSEEIVANEFNNKRSQYCDFKLTELIDLFCCNLYLDCIYKADFKNGIYDKNHINDLIAKIKRIDISNGGKILKLRFILLRYMPKFAYFLYRAVRVIRRKSISR